MDDDTTLRDVFAAAALAGIAWGELCHKCSADSIARASYELADAMMKARKTKASVVKQDIT